jgi:quinol monooxygenase YgiN
MRDPPNEAVRSRNPHCAKNPDPPETSTDSTYYRSLSFDPHEGMNVAIRVAGSRDSECKGAWMIGMTIDVKVSPDKQEEFLQVMLSLLGDREKQEGIKTSTLCLKADDKNGFILVCEWKTPEDLEEFLRAEIFKVLLGAITILCHESEITYNEVSDIQTEFLVFAQEP